MNRPMTLPAEALLLLRRTLPLAALLLLLALPAACGESPVPEPAAPSGEEVPQPGDDNRDETTPDETKPDETTPDETPKPDSDPTAMIRNIRLKIGGRTFAATLHDNAAARAFAQLLPLTLPMNELNGNEKYANLSTTLPTEVSRPGTIRTGDLMLYGNDCVVLFYKTFSSSYSYTPLGTLDTVDGLAEAVGAGRVQVTFEAAE